jgi:predicted adenylyl cyclase CyaB
MKNIEIEARSFITASQYKKLEAKLNKIAKFLGEINEETVYCGGERIRIRRDDNYSYLILKSGKIHDDFRDEIKVRFKRSDFEKLKEIFERLGFDIDVLWFRKRKIYDWKGIKVFLDDTKGYGKIIELERFGKEGQERKIHRNLVEKLSSLGVKITPKKVFEEKFNYYKNNWRKVLKYEHR